MRHWHAAAGKGRIPPQTGTAFHPILAQCTGSDPQHISFAVRHQKNISQFKGTSGAPAERVSVPTESTELTLSEEGLPFYD